MKKKEKAPIMLIFCLFILLSGCVPTTKQVCQATSLIIDKSVLPEGTSQDEIRSPVADEPTNSAFRELYLNHTSASQFAYAYSNDKRTKSKYEETIMNIFMVSTSSHSWKIPDFEFINSADESIYACGLLFDSYQCFWVSQYKNYLIEFGMDIDPAGFSIDDFRNSIVIIDKKMSNCLNNKQ